MFFFIKKSIIHRREKSQVMGKLVCPCESKPFIKIYFKYFDFFTRIWLNFLNFSNISSDIEVSKSTKITRTKIIMPMFPLIRNVSCLLEKFTLSTEKCIFIRKIKSSSWKRIKRHFSCRLFLFCYENFSLWSDRKSKCTIEKTYSFKSLYRAII